MLAFAQWTNNVIAEDGSVDPSYARLQQPQTSKSERAMLRPARIDTTRVAEVKRRMQPSFNENAYTATASFAVVSRTVAGKDILHLDDANYSNLPQIGGFFGRSPVGDEDET